MQESRFDLPPLQLVGPTRESPIPHATYWQLSSALHLLSCTISDRLNHPCCVRSPFYGMRLRLRPNVTAEVLRRRPDSERGANATAVDVVLTAMKTYGIMMADGSSNGVGGIPFMMASDRFSMTKWASIGIDSHFLFGLAVDDFEVLRPLDPTAGPKHDGRIKLTFDCERSAVDGGKRPVRAALTCQGHGTEGRSRWR